MDRSGDERADVTRALRPSRARGAAVARRARWPVALAASVLAASCSYTPGRLLHAYPTSARVSCLDVAIEHWDPRSVVAPAPPDAGVAPAPAGGPARGGVSWEEAPVLALRFGNRCDVPQRIDFAALRVEARHADGSIARLAPHDPNGEIRPALLDARAEGSERIRYLHPTGTRPASPVVAVCARLEHLGGPAPWNPPVTLCVRVPARSAPTLAAGDAAPQPSPW